MIKEVAMNEQIQPISDPGGSSSELIAILFVSHGANQNILFKFPFSYQSQSKNFNLNSKRSSPYALSGIDHLNFWIIEKEEKLISNGLLRGVESSILESIFLVNQNKNQPLELKVDNLFFLGSPVFVYHNTIKYNIIFAVKSPLPKPVIICYQRLSLDIVNALMKEEAHCRYLTKQLIYFHTDEQTTDLTFANLLKNSQLAVEFKRIFEEIKNVGIVNINFNGHINLSFCFPHLAYKIKEKLEQTHFVNIVLNSKDYLRSYHAILPLTSKDELLKSLPLDCCNKTRTLIANSSPQSCLVNYEGRCDLNDEELKLIIVHLIQWAKVKIIYPITDTNVYVVNPSAQIFINNTLTQTFSEKFPNKTLPLILEEFSISKTLIEHMDSKHPKEVHKTFLDIVIWLLERNLLLQVHTYIFLVVKPMKSSQYFNETSKSETSIDANSDFQDTSNGGGGSEHSNDNDGNEYKDGLIFEKYRKILAEKTELSEKEQQHVLRILHSKHEQEKERRLFMRFLKYFNGTMNVEEIIYEEKVNRSDVYMVLEAFKEILITCVYEDPNPLLRINVKIGH